MDIDIKKVDVKNLEIRSAKPSRNSHREVSITKKRRSARLSSRKQQQFGNRSRSASRVDSNYDDDVFSTCSARI